MPAWRAWISTWRLTSAQCSFARESKACWVFIVLELQPREGRGHSEGVLKHAVSVGMDSVCRCVECFSVDVRAGLLITEILDRKRMCHECLRTPGNEEQMLKRLQESGLLLRNLG